MRPLRGVGEEIEIELIISVFKKSPLAPVAPLRHMMRYSRQDEAWKASHGGMLLEFRG